MWPSFTILRLLDVCSSNLNAALGRIRGGRGGNLGIITPPRDRSPITRGGVGEHLNLFVRSAGLLTWYTKRPLEPATVTPYNRGVGALPIFSIYMGFIMRRCLSTALRCVFLVFTVAFLVSCDSGSLDRASRSRSSISDSEASTELTADGKFEAIIEAKRYITKQLKSPATADFPFLDYRAEYNKQSATWHVWTYVDSQNSFGATIRSNWKVAIKKIPEGWKVLESYCDGELFYMDSEEQGKFEENMNELAYELSDEGKEERRRRDRIATQKRVTKRQTDRMKVKRSWTDQESGDTFEATFHSYSSGKVSLIRDDKRIDIDMDKLDDSSKKFIRTRGKSED